MNSAPPILVTGAHRSGTTWVGRIIATAPSTAYLHEPFHPHHDARVCGARFDWWFTYVCAENAGPYEGSIRAMLDEARRPVDDRAEAAGRRPVIKDPIAIFAAPWLASRFDTRNVVMIRHPAAFAGSLKATGWTHPFAHFLAQPLLMRDYLGPFARDLMRFAREERDIVDQAAFLWTLIHATIARFEARHPDWIFLRHEDLSRDPIGGFRRLFARLDLDFTPATEAAIDAHSFPETNGSPGGDPLKRDSLANITGWRDRLTAEDVARVRARVDTIARRFYTDEDW